MWQVHRGTGFLRKNSFSQGTTLGLIMPQQHQTQYWVTCFLCGHQMEVADEAGPDRRGKHCDKCHANFSYTKDKLAIAESLNQDPQPAAETEGS